MKLQIVKGSTSQIITVFIQDNTATDGSGLSGLDQTSSIVGGYVRAGGTGLALAVDENVTTEGTYEAPTTDNQVRIGTPANMTAGTYELHFHNDLFASGADSVFITLGGASNMAVLVIEIQLTDLDLNTAVDAAGTAAALHAATNVKVDRNADLVESQRGAHAWQGNVFYVDFQNGNDSTGDGSRALPYKTLQNAMIDLVTAWNHDVIFLLAGDGDSLTTHTTASAVVCNKAYCFIRGPGRDMLVTRSSNGNTFEVTADGVELSGMRIETHTTGAGDAVEITGADFAKVRKCWFTAARSDAVSLAAAEHCVIHKNTITNSGVGGASAGVRIDASAGNSDFNVITDNIIVELTGDGILITDAGGGNTIEHTIIHGNRVIHNTGTGINISGANVSETIAHGNISRFNTTADFADTGTDTITENNEQWAKAETVAYLHAAIWIDTVGGAAGTIVGVNGTRGNPVDNLPNAVTLAAALGINEYHLLGASSIMLVSAHQNWVFFGQDGATVNIGGQNVSGTHFECLTLTGDADSNDITARYCKLQSLTNLTGSFEFCILVDNATLVAGDTHFIQCSSGVAGTATPYIDLDGDDANARNLHLRGYFGGVEIRTHTSTDLTSFDCPAGQLIIHASCTGGTIARRGVMNFTDNAAAAVSIEDNAALNKTEIADGVLIRGASNIEDTADRHSLGAMVMIGTNSSIAGATLTAKKPSDDSTFATYTVTVDASADPITGVS